MATEYIHAGFWIRVAAMLIDSLILGMLNALLIASFLGTDYLVMEGSVAHPYDLLITTTLYLINFAYFAGSTSSSWQATPGDQRSRRRAAACGWRVFLHRRRLHA